MVKSVTWKRQDVVMETTLIIFFNLTVLVFLWEVHRMWNKWTCYWILLYAVPAAGLCIASCGVHTKPYLWVWGGRAKPLKLGTHRLFCTLCWTLIVSGQQFCDYRADHHLLCNCVILPSRYFPTYGIAVVVLLWLKVRNQQFGPGVSCWMSRD